MLENCINSYNESIWYEDQLYLNPSWQIAYHVLYFANIYCSSTKTRIKHWEGEIPNYYKLYDTIKKKPKGLKMEKQYSKDEISKFLNHFRNLIPKYLASMIPNKKCWPNWYNISQFEFQINNIRHIQHHTAQLIERHDNKIEMPYEWF